MVAVTEEQTEDLAYGAVHAILTEDTCGIAEDFDVGLETTRLVTGRGEIKPLASAPSARDGARTTFQHFDETHLFTSERLKRSHRTMLRNIPKRKTADSWSLETTTAYAPGEGSIAEEAHQHAEQVAAGEVEDHAFWYDHLQASEQHDLTTDKGLEAAIAEASGDAIAWTDVEAIKQLYRNPRNPEPESRRYWFNQPRGAIDRWITPLAWASAEHREPVEDGGEIYLGFWGGVNRTEAGLVACTPDGYAFVVESWEPAYGLRVTTDEVEAAIADTYNKFEVVELVTSRLGGSGWITEIEDWSDQYGNIVEIPVHSPARMGPACDRAYTAIHDGELTHDGNETLARHIANCVPARSVHGTYIRPGPGENQHITLARALVLAHERARIDSEVEVQIMVI